MSLLNQRVKLLWLWGMQRLHGWDVMVIKISDYVLNYENEVRIGM